jgi:hypothetical protein
MTYTLTAVLRTLPIRPAQHYPSATNTLDDRIFVSDPFFPCSDIVEVDECHMRWQGETATGVWEEVADEDYGSWIFGLTARRTNGDPHRLRVFCVVGRKIEDLIGLIEEVVEENTLCAVMLMRRTMHSTHIIDITPSIKK